MNEKQMCEAIVRLYDWICSERHHYLDMWETTEDEGMKTYYGEKTSTYTSIKLYLSKYLGGVISAGKRQEKH